MKPIKIGLRVWIALTSLASFLAGWIVFSHAGKPTPLFSASTSNNTQPTVSTTVDPISTLPPIPSLNSLVTDPQAATSGSTTTSNNTFVRPSPRLRSGGS